MATPDLGKLDLSDAEDEVLWASPSRATLKSTSKANPTTSSNPNPSAQRSIESRYDAEQAREAALQKELESVRSINEVIEGVVSSLERAKGNMDASCPSQSRAITPSLTAIPDCLSHSDLSVNTFKYLDSDPLTDRT
jgi:hypothetical protein